MLAAVDDCQHRSAERLPPANLDHGTECDALLCEVAQHLAVRVGHAHEAPAVSGIEGVEALGRGVLDLQRRAGDRVTVRVALGISELLGDQPLELRADHVLERVGLVVHAVP